LNITSFPEIPLLDSPQKFLAYPFPPCAPSTSTLKKEKKKLPDELASSRGASVLRSSDQFMVAFLSLLSLFPFISARHLPPFVCILDVLVALMTVMPAFYDLYLSSLKRPLCPNTPLSSHACCLILLLFFCIIELVSLTTAVLPLVFYMFLLLTST